MGPFRTKAVRSKVSLIAGEIVLGASVTRRPWSSLETRYLDGQASLLADADIACLSPRNWRRSPRADERRLSKDRGQVFDQRVQDRACKLADDARISTFDRLGENSRALAILQRRLSGDANGAAAGPPE
jgi:hypothetical protein